MITHCNPTQDTPELASINTPYTNPHNAADHRHPGDAVTGERSRQRRHPHPDAREQHRRGAKPTQPLERAESDRHRARGGRHSRRRGAARETGAERHRERRQTAHRLASLGFGPFAA